MRFSLIAFTALLMFGGCAEKDAFDLFKMDEAHERSVEELRSASIVESMETKAIVSTVYLNRVYPGEYKEGECFVGAFYFPKTLLDTRKWSLKEFGYTLTMNGKEPLEIEELKSSDPRRLLIPVQNNWNKYYFIRFETSPVPSLTLRLENNQTGSAVLNYQKVQ